MENEDLAKVYCELIVNTAVNEIIKAKTQRQKRTVDILQAKVDSVANLLGQKTTSGAALQTSSTTMDINPLYRTGTAVAFETTVRDKTMLGTIFASVTQNLEMAKFTLSQETPIIQIIDNPNLPLKRNKVSKLVYLIIGGFIGCFIGIIWIVIKKIFNTINT